ncbi:peptide MFS transporter [Flavobacterium sp. ov086]|uniref:peptide MFS transporter n=1 Tax=Flavobacterium sp. ov086 TaxID=1761785 RepID=UPI000B6C4424|nr:peptide MFS transporter [Flavobacterium sp. ov086]SNR22715.1 proton-dependent oligopeptide transporter, POT family [Flavobacterium sp. ov086]
MGETQVKTAHPKGLWVLFGTEMWERFNFYGMRALLTLFLVNSLLMKEEEASLIYGGFLGLCYLTPMLGGFVADRFLGNRNCILLGGLLMAIGQMLLFTSGSVFESNLGLAKTIMYSALGVIVFGNGFFKPNISSMVGSLYPKQEKTKLDTAFTIFYMGINIGAFLGQSICPLLGDVVDRGGVRDIHAFKWGFLAASVAMLLGTILFYVLKNKYVVSPEGRPLGGLPSKNVADDFEEGEAQKANFSTRALIGAGIAFLVLGLFFHYVVGQNLIYTLIYSSGLALAGLIISDSSLTKVERDRIIVIYIVSFFIIFFWAAFEQAGSSLTFIANNQTDRNFFGIWNMPPSMVQIFNGLFVVVLAVPFSVLWDSLRAKSKEPISPVKLAIGLVLITVSFFMIATQVSYIGTSGLLLVKWLILLYFLNTCAELCLSPIGLSLVGKLSPKRFASLLFGVFFLSNASGYALGGTLGSILPPTGDKYKAAEKVNIDLASILENKTVANGVELFALAKLQIAKIDKEKSKEFGLDVEKKIETIAEIKSQKELAAKTNVKFVNTFTAKDTTFTAKEFDLLKEKNIVTVSYPEFAGFIIHNLYEFFMVFVVLTGIAALVLFALTPFLKKMMHGVR